MENLQMKISERFVRGTIATENLLMNFFLVLFAHHFQQLKCNFPNEPAWKKIQEEKKPISVTN